MSTPRNHHFVPQGYMKRLVRPDTTVHYVKKGSRIISDTSTKKLCSEIDGYKLVSVAPEDAQLLDTTYKTLWEDHYDEVYKNLVDDRQESIDDRLRELVVGTVCSLLFRSRRIVNAVDSLMRQSIDFMANARRLDGSQPKIGVLDGKEYELEGKSADQLWAEYQANTNNDAVLTTQFTTGFRLQQVRMGDSISVTRVVGTTGFISSDNPTRIHYPPNAGIVAPFNVTDVLSLPLNEEYRVELVPGVPGADPNRIYRFELKGSEAEAEVLDYNIRQFSEAEKLIIGRKGALEAIINHLNRAQA
ncbi:MAG TPA: DUF4238 domain-containing protein [Flavobacteriales bacterium]|nr:DUF4238 domain-containing protein [Flavobacteriales bacterium]